MRLEQSFDVPVPVARAWAVLLDLEQVAPCMPGATLTGFNGTEFTGLVKVKLGPVNLAYKGNGRFVERDEAGRRVAFVASGQDSRGAGGASARVTAVLHDNDGGATTTVKVVADLDIAGRAAQFGRGMVLDVSTKLVQQFADCLARTITGAPEAAAAPAAAPPAAGPAAPPAPPAPPVTPLLPVHVSPLPNEFVPPPEQEYHPLAMQEPPAGAEAPPAPPPAPAPQVEPAPEVKPASAYAYEPEPQVPPAPPAAATPAPMTLSRPHVEGEPIDLLAVSGAKRKLLPVVIVAALVVVAVVVWLIAR